MTGFSGRGARAVAVASGVFALSLFGASAAQAETLVFHPGPEQSFVVPSGVTKIKVTAVGERGGGASCFITCFSRIPEVVSGTLTVKPGQTIYADFAGAGPGGGSDRGGNAEDAPVPTGPGDPRPRQRAGEHPGQHLEPGDGIARHGPPVRIVPQCPGRHADGLVDLVGSGQPEDLGVVHPVAD